MANVNLEEMGRAARQAAYDMARMEKIDKRMALKAVMEGLKERYEEILAANAVDIANGRNNNMPEGLVDRLLLTKERIFAMADAVMEVSLLPDPIGEIMMDDTRPNGLRIIKRRVPIGVVGIIYEARPNVTSDAFAIAFQSSNAVILKGGSDAIHSNMAVTRVIRDSLAKQGVNPDAVQLIADTSHETAQEFMRLTKWVDVLIPRGSARLIDAVVKNSSVPVIETGAGNCHIYLDDGCQIPMAVEIVFNAKTQRIGVCNAAESLVVSRAELKRALPAVIKKLQEKDVSVMADEESLVALRNCEELRQDLIFPAAKEDFGTEYLDYKISVKTVSDTEEAITHINRYSTGHSEAIITENEEDARLFLKNVDSACVYWNASTRFTDGGEFGFGAEIGISTSRLHARGPMGVRELTTMKYEIIGNGQVR